MAVKQQKFNASSINQGNGILSTPKPALRVTNTPSQGSIINTAPKAPALSVYNAPQGGGLGPSQNVNLGPAAMNINGGTPAPLMNNTFNTQNAAGVQMGANFNQPTVTPAVQPGGGTPIQNGASGSWGASEVANPALAGGIKFMNGEGYDANGNYIPPTNSNNPDPSSFGNGPLASAQIDPSVSTDSGTVGGQAKTGYDIQSLLADNNSRQQSLLDSISSLYNPTPDELATKDQIASTTQEYQNKDTALGTQGILTAVATAQQTGNLNYYQNKLNYLTQTLNNQLSTRQQKLQAAQFLFTANQQNTNQLVDNFIKLAPQNIGTKVNDVTGDVYVFTKDPITGQVTTQKVGNTGPGAKQASIQKVGQHYDPMSGQMVDDYAVVTQGQDGIQVTPLNGAGSSNSSAVPGANGTPYTAPQLQSGGVFNQDAATGLTTPAAVNNNPGNLRDPQTGGWQKFATPEQGFQALVQDVIGKQTGQTRTGLNGNSTLGQFFQVYAPSSDHNDPAGYAATVAKNLGVSTSTPISKLDPVQLATAIAQHEDGKYWAAINTPQKPQAPDINAIKQSLPPILGSAIKQMPDGTPYFDGNYLPDTASVKQAQYFEQLTGIKYVQKDDASKLAHINVTMDNLKQMQSDAEKILGGGLIGRLKGVTLNPIQHGIQSNNTISAFNAYRDTAINAIQALAAGNGQGFRLNSAEIETAANNLPTIRDNIQTARTKLNLVMGFLNKWTQQILPGTGTNTNGAENDPLGIR